MYLFENLSNKDLYNILYDLDIEIAYYIDMKFKNKKVFCTGYEEGENYVEIRDKNYNYSDVEFSKIDLVKKYNFKIEPPLNKFLFFLDYFDNKGMDYIKMEEEDGIISYMNMDRIKNDIDPFNNRYRQNIRIGRFIKKIIPKLSQPAIENTVNKYLAFISIIKKRYDNIRIVKGKEITKWYLESSYNTRHKGTLGNSCMRHEEFQKVLKFYSKNEDSVRLVIYVNDKNKLLARSLLWKTNKGIYLDRIYSEDDYQKYFLIKMADKNGWMNYYKDKSKKMKVVLKEWKFSKYPDEEDYPYLDTFKYLIIKGKNSGTVYNEEPNNLRYDIDFILLENA